MNAYTINMAFYSALFQILLLKGNITMTDFLYPDILNEQLTYARQARAAWLWTNVAERSRIFLQVLDTLQPICASLARDSVQETGYGI